MNRTMAITDALVYAQRLPALAQEVRKLTHELENAKRQLARHRTEAALVLSDEQIELLVAGDSR